MALNGNLYQMTFDRNGNRLTVGTPKGYTMGYADLQEILDHVSKTFPSVPHHKIVVKLEYCCEQCNRTYLEFTNLDDESALSEGVVT